MEVSVLNIKGADTGRKVTLNDAIFAIEPNDHAIYLDVKRHMAAKRQGTAKTKERSELSGSTRKLGRQKGGGGARRGDINSPLLVGGARVFGPTPRDYDFKLNKKVKLLEDFNFEAPKTKSFVELVENLKVSDKKVLLVLPSVEKNVYLSARNLKRAKVMTASQLNTYSVLDAGVMVVTESSLSSIDAILIK